MKSNGIIIKRPTRYNTIQICLITCIKICYLLNFRFDAYSDRWMKRYKEILSNEDVMIGDDMDRHIGSKRRGYKRIQWRVWF